MCLAGHGLKLSFDNFDNMECQYGIHFRNAEVLPPANYSIFIILCVWCFKENFFRLIDFTAIGVKSRVAAVKDLPLLHHSAHHENMPI